MENLPTEVIVDILSRLPVKTIVHCKCVCKKWHNLVNNSYFINLHLSRSPVGLMVVHHDANILDDGDDTPGILKWVEIEDKHDHHRLHHEPVINFDLSGPTWLADLTPVDSVNGLICISQLGGNVDNIYICNPITREYLTVPRQQIYKGSHGFNKAYKFGVNSLTGEYKVLRIFRDPPPSSAGPPPLLEAEVYTLGTSQWRSVGQVPPYWFDGLGRPFLNGYFHWTAHGQNAPESICTFDLDKETFQLFPSPPTAMEEYMGTLGVLKGCLCKSYTCNSQFTIWVMKQYGIKESWHKELVIKRGFFAGVEWPMRKYMYVFGGLQDGSILLVYANKVLAYCPKSKTIEDVAILDRWFVVLNHRPSFIKLRNIDLERVHSF